MCGILNYTIITYVLFKLFGHKKGILFLAIVYALTFKYSFCSINFTTTGAFISATATFYLLYLLKDNDKKRKFLFRSLAIIYLLFGTLFRQEILYVALVFFALATLIILINKIKLNKDNNTKQNAKGLFTFLKPYLITLLILAVVGLLLILFSNLICNLDKRTKEYFKYNEVRSSIMDYELPSYDENKNLYSSLGLDENDYYLLAYGLYDTKTNSTYYNFNNLAVKKNNSFFDFSNNFKSVISSYSSVNILCLGVLGLFLLIKKKPFDYIYYIILFGSLLAFIYYLSSIGRQVYRARYVPITQFILLSIFTLSLTKDREFKPKPTFILKTTAVVLTLITCSYSIFSFYVNKGKVIKGFDFNSHKETTYVVNAGNLISDSIFKVVDYKNAVYAMGWMLYSPYLDETSKDKFNSTNFYQSLIDNENAELLINDFSSEIDSNIIKEFIEIHYNKYYAIEGKKIVLEKSYDESIYITYKVKTIPLY